jgi:diacylglycerol kinase (ATP)
MRKAALLYNPVSGGSRAPRHAELESVLAVLQAAGVQAELIPCHSRDHAQEQARRAMQSGCDTVFACGGDGTVHDIVQVLAKSQVALAILPMGTANTLAHDLQIPFDLVAAARKALRASPRRIALGHVEYVNLDGKSAASYFVVAAGAGVDAHLFHELHPTTKQRLGMGAYYVKAWHLWFSYIMTRFAIEYIESGSSQSKQADVTELLGVRIRNFGGVLQELAPGASLDRDDLRLVVCRTSSRLAYLLYVIRTLLRRNWAVPGIELAYSKKVSCRYLPTSTNTLPEVQLTVYLEADGELLGKLPAEMTTVPDALTILAPPSPFQRRHPETRRSSAG